MRTGKNEVGYDEYNRKALKAWTAWKDVCWVDGVGKSIDGRPPIGTPDDAEVLRREIKNAFLRKVLPYRMYLEDENGKSKLDDLDFAGVFDNALVEYEHAVRYDRGYFGEKEHVRTAKAWKDFTWAAVRESDDPELKVIRGKLTGPLSVINQVVEEWLMSEYPCWLEVDPVTGKDVLKIASSWENMKVEKANDIKESTDSADTLAASARQCEERSVDDASGDLAGRTRSPSDQEEEQEEREDYGVSDDVIARWESQLDKAIDSRRCCLLLAKVMGLKIYEDEEILEALEICKSVAAVRIKKIKDNPGDVLKDLDVELRDWILHDVNGTRFWLNWIKKRAETEKAGSLILSRMKAMN